MFYLVRIVNLILLMLVILAESLMNLNRTIGVLTNFFMFLFFYHIVENTMVVFNFVFFIYNGLWLLGSVWILKMILICLKIWLCISLSLVLLRLTCWSGAENILSWFLLWQVIRGLHHTVLDLLVKYFSMIE